ncbi:unnamed protein product [Urochloa decumbens]|uniref:Uncharacterized protein n=1 Tax=Urochloa decumbens TaxID=240449 RepID=A0ABC9AKS3_9POAL
MDAKLVLVACLLLLCRAGTAAAGCSLSSIVVSQSDAHDWAHGKPVYAVTVRNTCVCPQSDVTVDCAGYDTTFEPDVAKFKVIGGGLCLINSGAPVVQGQDVTFRYAWSKKFEFQPISSTVECS